MSGQSRLVLSASNAIQIRILTIIAVAIGSRSAPAQDPLLWGSLKPGPYAVGYRASYQLDHTREYDPEFTTDPSKPPAHRPRPILVCIWYPAKKTGSQPLEYRQYLDVTSPDPQIASFVKRLSHHIRVVLGEGTVGKDPAKMTAPESAAFERFLATRTTAVKDAPAADGRFPVVIYHSGLGGTHEDDSVLFELLASHGYVVLSSAYPRPDADTVQIGSDLQCSFRDMEWLARAARDLPFADADRLGAMGHSWGAIAVLHWAAVPDSPLRAFVTFDSGFEYVSVEDCGAEPLMFHMRTNKGNIRAPALRFASIGKNANFDLLEPHLKFAPRYEAAVASLTHDEYLTPGAVRSALMPDKWPDPMKAKRTSYDRICQHVLHFFDATLKQQASAHEALQRSIRGEGLDDGFKLRFRSADRVAPTYRQTSIYLKQNGVEKTIQLLQSFNQSTVRLGGAADGLIQDGYPREALPALEFVTKEHPTWAIFHARLGQALSLTGDKKRALAEYQKAAELLPNDKSVGTAGEVYKFIINQGLKELGQAESPPKNR